MSSDWEHDLERLARQVEEIRAAIDLAEAARVQLVVPPVAQFVFGTDYLAQSKLYPRQLTLLKVAFCDLEGLTAYDHRVIDKWCSGFELRPHTPGTTVRHWEPASDQPFVSGTPGDLIARMQLMRKRGRRWMRELNLVMGRRAGKGHVGALIAARLVYELLALGDAQKHFGVPRSKRLVIPVFAGNRHQAEFNLFADIATVIVEAPCFRPYLVKLTKDRLVLATPADLARPDRAFDGSIEIQAKEATGVAGRGIASPFQFYDEMAFVDPTTSKASAEAIYRGATPAMDQFGDWSLVAELSSPYQQMGEFFEIHRRAREVDPVTEAAVYPEVMTLQLPSWAPYEDADIATTIPMVTAAQADVWEELRGPDGAPRTFPSPGPPICAYDDQMRQHERANPVAFDVERRSQWGTVDSPFLQPHLIGPVFEPWNGETLRQQDQGKLNVDYLMVLDPASVHDAFAVVIGHREPADAEGRAHVIVDRSYRFLPADYGGELDMTSVLDQVEADIRAFRARVITDQYGGPFVVADLNRRLLGRSFGGHAPVRQAPRTRDRNVEAASLLREALFLRQVHAPPMPEMERELRFLREKNGKVEAPTAGPVQTDDLAIALMGLVADLLGAASEQPVFDALSGFPLHGRPGPVPDPVHDRLRAFGEGRRVGPSGPHRSGVNRGYPRRWRRR